MSTVIETDEQPGTRPERRPTGRSVLMCRPEHFIVSYRINPWMHPAEPTDTKLAVRQWEELYDIYLDLGFDVQLIDPIAGLPDMVYAANGGFMLDGIAYGARFQYAERGPEGPAYMDWFRGAGFEVREPVSVNEGEGDFLLVGDTHPRRHRVPQRRPLARRTRRIYGREVVTLRLVDPSFYHLDTAIAVLDTTPGQEHIAYLPKAFDEASLAGSSSGIRMRHREREDAAVLGLNSFSDGNNVVIASRAAGFERQLRERGYTPIGVDLSELLLGGGGVKCCTLELRR